MPQSLHVLTVHMVFSTKSRRPWLKPEIRPQLWAYMARILENLECELVTAGGVEDHAHVLCNLTKKHAPMKVMEVLKKDSSKFAKTLHEECQEFQWQDGYGLFSVSPSHRQAVREYVLRQEEHHRKESFQEELRRILKKHGVEVVEEHLWD